MKTVAISILGTVLDRRGKRQNRWDKWRPTVSICQQDDLVIDRLELIFDNHSLTLAEQVKDDIEQSSPETEVVFHKVNYLDPWDFEDVYSQLLDFSRAYDFNTDTEDYLVHITTGTHVAQICLYLLTESGYLPGKLIQTSPSKSEDKAKGSYQIIDLDLSRYDQIASRFNKEHTEGTTHLKSGIDTKNEKFNLMIEQLEKVSIRSNEPILITGPTGAGKSKLAERIYQLRKQRAKLKGKLITVNCATLRGDNAISALFGHKKGAFTGAAADRTGLLREANDGLLFLDEIGELGLDEQAMLLSAIEDKHFMPLGSDKMVFSDFQLIVGTNRDLIKQSQQGKFREDLLARIDLWTYRLPALKERLEDFDANLDFELDKFSSKAGYLVKFNKAAREKYLAFSKSPAASWNANFRDLNASITRMSTLSDGGRITEDLVAEEVLRLKHKWRETNITDPTLVLQSLLDEKTLNDMDYYDHLTYLISSIFAATVNQWPKLGELYLTKVAKLKKSSNDSHRVKQLLSKLDISFEKIRQLP